MANVGFGLIGTGFMGRTHAIALRSVATVFAEVNAPRLVSVADRDADSAASACRDLGFERSTGEWEELLEDPAIDVVDICAPNYLHYPMSLAALKAGKHVYCEKPLALTVDEASGLAALAETSGRVHAVGLNYTTNPMVQTAREIIGSGEIGNPVSFTGRYFEDYMASTEVPFTWRCDRSLAGSGALADLGSHLINMLHFLLGRPSRLCGDCRIVIPSRRVPATGEERAVENEDIARALIELESGIPATIEISRVASGYKCGLQFEVFGTRGSIAFDQERMNELRLYEAGQQTARAGFKTILAGPAHPDYARFCPAPGHGLGINDLKVIEVRNLVRAIERNEPFQPDFEEGLRVQQVMAAIEESSTTQAWVDLDLSV
jgi:predicted dehydrogenase